MVSSGLNGPEMPLTSHVPPCRRRRPPTTMSSTLSPTDFDSLEIQGQYSDINNRWDLPDSDWDNDSSSARLFERSRIKALAGEVRGGPGEMLRRERSLSGRVLQLRGKTSFLSKLPANPDYPIKLLVPNCSAKNKLHTIQNVLQLPFPQAQDSALFPSVPESWSLTLFHLVRPSPPISPLPFIPLLGLPWLSLSPLTPVLRPSPLSSPLPPHLFFPPAACSFHYFIYLFPEAGSLHPPLVSAPPILPGLLSTHLSLCPPLRPGLFPQLF